MLYRVAWSTNIKPPPNAPHQCIVDRGADRMIDADSELSAMSAGQLARQRSLSANARPPIRSTTPLEPRHLEFDFEPCAATASIFLFTQDSFIICLHHDTLTVDRRFERHKEQILFFVRRQLQRTRSGTFGRELRCGADGDCVGLVHRGWNRTFCVLWADPSGGMDEEWQRCFRCERKRMGIGHGQSWPNGQATLKGTSSCSSRPPRSIFHGGPFSTRLPP